MIEIKEKNDCCGCNACGDICAQNAITFKTDIEGFWYPIINSEKCTNCGLCEKICPMLHAEELKKSDLERPVCYAAEHKNLAVIFDSTSGGAFTEFAEKMYRNNGYVGGAIFNDDFSVRHYISNDRNDLTKLRNSKYLQSDMSTFFNTVRELAERGEKLLICGCPCQIAALKNFAIKDYDNIVLVDFICKGNGSPKAWRKYLDSFEARYGSPVVYAKAKSKEYGWSNLTQKVTLANGKTYYETRTESAYTIGYNEKNILERPVCYVCPFKGFPRISDITIADYWGIEKHNPSMGRDLGTSLIILNSEKGQQFFEELKENMTCVEMPLQTILSGGNFNLVRSLNPPKIDRKTFYEDMDTLDFSQVVSKYLHHSVSRKEKIRSFLKMGYNVLIGTRLHPISVLQLLAFNNFRNAFSLLKSNSGLIPYRHCIMKIGRKAKISIKGLTRLGHQRISGSKLETRFVIQDGATFEVNGDLSIHNGSEIQVLKNAVLKFGGQTHTNINCTIVCAERIEIGKGVMIGRNVTIKDTNGPHYLNKKNYKAFRPIVIEDKVWLTEACIIMPGVHIGQGAVIGAHAVVMTNVPAYSVVMGNPARVIDKDVLIKP